MHTKHVSIHVILQKEKMTKEEIFEWEEILLVFAYLEILKLVKLSEAVTTVVQDHSAVHFSIAHIVLLLYVWKLKELSVSGGLH